MTKKPNLLFIFPDQMRGSAMGFLGEEPVITPNLDKLASESLVLRDAASNYPVCVPYRTALMSGKYAVSNGVLVNCFLDKREMADDMVWWTDVLKKNRYATAYYGKWHITLPVDEWDGRTLTGPARNWLPPAKRHGVDHWEIQTSNKHMDMDYVRSGREPEDIVHPGKWTVEHEADLAIDFLRNEDGQFREDDQPFALILSMNPPHDPCPQVPQKYIGMYDGMDVEACCHAFPSLPPVGTRYGDRYRNKVKNYYAAVSGIDENVGRILACLEEVGEADNTIVVFTADHGDLMGTHNCMDPKNYPWEQAIRIPFLIRWPGQIAPRTDDLLISVPDVYPTLMELMDCDGDIPDDLEGDSYAKLILGENQQRPTSQLYMHIKEPDGDLEHGRRGVRMHKYTFSVEHMPGVEREMLLYDNEADPHQLTNLADSRPDIVRRLIDTELNPWLKRTNDPFQLDDLRLGASFCE